MVLIAGGWFTLNSQLGSIDKKLESLGKKMDSKFESMDKKMDSQFEFLRSELKEISKESNQRILALEVDKGVREAMVKERRRHDRRPGDQGQDLSRSK